MQQKSIVRHFLDPFFPKLAVALGAAALACAPLSFAQQPSPNGSSPNNQDVPHQTPGTNNPDVSKQRQPEQGSAPGSTPSPKDPTQNSGDVPHQEPGTNSPDLGKQRQPDSGTSTASSTGKPKKKSKHRKDTTTTS